MALDEKTALEVIMNLAKEGRITKKIAQFMYRPDAQDYVVLFDDETGTLIREKLVTLFYEQKLSDAKREILGRLKNAAEIEVYLPPQKAEEKISVEDET